MSIDEYRMKEFLLFYLLKKQSEATATIRQSLIFIRHSMKFHISAALAKKTARLIEIETFGARFRILLLLGFAIRNNTGKM